LASSRKVEERLGLKFREPSLLVEALTHPSFLNENPTVKQASYERLEFLGDAVLGAVAAAELYNCFPELQEGQMTKLRAHLVQRESLARSAGKLGLGEALLMGYGEEMGGGRGRGSNLASALEAVVGAVFLDQGYEKAKGLVLNLLGDEIDNIRESGLPKDPKSYLQEIVQARVGIPPQYVVLSEEGQDHSRQFTIEVRVEGKPLASGTGRRKVEAERQAASRAIEILTGEALKKE
jgi:ribonuclease-3